MDDVDAVRADELSQAVVDEARRLHDAVTARSLVLRLTGSFAVRERCPDHAYLLGALGRRPFRDLDYMGYSYQKKEISQLFEALDYRLDPVIKLSMEWGVKRLTYNRQDGLKVDIFFDELVMAHTVPFKGRLEQHPFTVSIVDLLLSKLQIYEITENDLIDIVVLFAEHDLEPREDGGVDTSYLCSILADDWGFYFTALRNLRKVEEALGRYDALPKADRASISSRVSRLRDLIQAEPKSLKWRLRSRVGQRVRWYQEVSELDR